MKKSPEELADAVDSKERFLQFLDALADDFDKNHQEWENRSIKDYLSAISLFTESIEGYYKNNNLDTPLITPSTWKVITDILMAGKIYE